MFRQGVISCQQALERVTKAAIQKLTLGGFPFQPVQPAVPAVQFLTIPLRSPHNTPRRGRRYFSTSTPTPLSSPSSFREDYDEWYSHGKVANVTRPTLDDEVSYYQEDPSISTSVQSNAGFLLDEIEREQEELLFDARRKTEQEMMFDAHLNEKLQETAVIDDLDEDDFLLTEGGDEFEITSTTDLDVRDEGFDFLDDEQ